MGYLFGLVARSKLWVPGLLTSEREAVKRLGQKIEPSKAPPPGSNPSD